MSSDDGDAPFTDDIPEEDTMEAPAPAPAPGKKSNWEKELVKRLEVTWGDAKAILQIAKSDLGIDPKDYPEESKEDIFAKCDEVAESFEKTPRVSLTPYPLNSLKKAVETEEEKAPAWEEEIKKEYKCSMVDATTLLQMAKHEMDVEEGEYPPELKEAIMEKVKELSDGFDFAKAPEPATIVFVKDIWADELSDELGCRITNAKQLLLLAKRELGLPEDEPGPPERKEEIFAEAREIAKTYNLTPKDKTEESTENSKVATAVVILLIIIVIVVGVSLGVTTESRNNDEAAPETSSPTSAPDETIPTTEAPSSDLSTDCVQVQKEFSETALGVSMAVTADISETAINYAAAVFERTFEALVAGIAEGQPDYCDPYCRSISSIEVVGTDIFPAVDDSFLEDGCDSELDMTFQVNGTFVGCEDTEFPGLLGTPARRQLWRDLARQASLQTESYLRGMNGQVRWLQDEPLCGSCPDDSASLGNVVPTEDEMIEIIDPLLSILPSICAVTDIVTLEEGSEAGGDVNATETEGQGPPEEGWAPIDCETSLSSENCPAFLAADSGAIPCSCDGQCIQYINGVFLGCNDSGEIGGVSGEVVINAAGCTFAEHAADLEGFTCLP